VVNSARLTLGFIYFELSSFKTAIKNLGEISPDFSDYPKALLTLGWAAFKLQDYQRAISALSSLVQSYPQFQELEEAHFVLGHCYLRLGYHDFAIREYNKIIDATPEAEEYASLMQQTKDSLAQKEGEWAVLKKEFAEWQNRLVADLGLQPANGLSDSTLAARFQKARAFREELLKQVQEHEKKVLRVSNSVAELRAKLEKSEVQKKWRSYAEYGRVRALYLKGIGIR
jgi:tetratricopeptide (TPR) repeat protein